MFDTYVTIVGNVLTVPEWRRTTQSGTLVANFKVASTARRIDKESGRWVDGNSLRVRVTCWRRLAEGVAASVMVGDPVMVAGRMYTRDWTDEAGVHRTLYEVEAVAVGHDLSRGRAKFLRNRPSLATSAVEDEESEARVRGESSEPVPPGEAPTSPGDVPLDEDEDFLDSPVVTFDGYPVGSPDLDGPVFPFDAASAGAVERAHGADTVDLADIDSGTGRGDDLTGGVGAVRSVGIAPGIPTEDGRGTAVDQDPIGLGDEVTGATAIPAAGSRGRRGRARSTVSA